MQEYSVSFITAAIALVAMAIFLSVDFITNVKKTIWMRLFDKAPYIIGGLLVSIAAILEKEKIINTIKNSTSWICYVVLSILAFNVLLILLFSLSLLIRGNKAERQEADA